MTHILVIDDEGASVAGLRALLELEGYSVTALQSSELALEIFGSERFDAVITDLEMPVVSGIEIVRAARAAHPGIPVFVATGYGGSPAAEAALAAGARSIIDKPLDFEHLGRELTAALSGGRR